MQKSMNKKQFEEFHDIKKINAYLKKNKVLTRLYAEKDFHGDYDLKWQCDAGNLPDQLQELKIAKAIRAEYYALVKANTIIQCAINNAAKSNKPWPNNTRVTI